MADFWRMTFWNALLFNKSHLVLIQFSTRYISKASMCSDNCWTTKTRATTSWTHGDQIHCCKYAWPGPRHSNLFLHKQGMWININMPSYQYRDTHYGDKLILRPSYVHNWICYTSKMTSLYWITDQVYWRVFSKWTHLYNCYRYGSSLVDAIGALVL